MSYSFIPNQRRSSRTLITSTIPQNSLTKRSLPFIKDLCSIDYDRMYNKFYESVKLPYVIGYNNLPTEIKTQIVEIVKRKKPVSGQCFFYSQFISSQIEGVNQVLGFFKCSRSKQILKQLSDNGIILQPFKKYNILDTPCIIDEKFNIWLQHGWNEYKGVYFDCLNEELYKTGSFYKFTEYRMVDYKRTFNYKKSQRLELLNNYTQISGSIGK